MPAIVRVVNTSRPSRTITRLTGAVPSRSHHWQHDEQCRAVRYRLDPSLEMVPCACAGRHKNGWCLLSPSLASSYNVLPRSVRFRDGRAYERMLFAFQRYTQSCGRSKSVQSTKEPCRHLTECRAPEEAGSALHGSIKGKKDLSYYYAHAPRDTKEAPAAMPVRTLAALACHNSTSIGRAYRFVFL